MLAAIYARKSTEQANVGDEEKSVTRQIEHAKAYAAKKGWDVLDDHIFIDDGISGAEFVKRPAFLRLMNALKPRPPFQVLIMSEESRLGREQIETAYAMKQITDAGVRVFFYLEDRERTLDSALDKVMLSLTNFAGEMERERAKQRTYDAMLRKAKAGHVTGGKVYGYRNQVVLAADGRRLHVVRVIDEEQAAVVRRIFQMYSDHVGVSRIAKQLNEEKIPPSRGHAGWCPSAIREILLRPLYQGVIVWGELQKIERRGTKKRRRRSNAELTTVEAPQLRIVSADLWSTVQKRFQENRRTSDQYDKRGMVKHFDSPYLLSGLARCGHCRGPMEALGRDYQRRKGRVYGCAYHRKRGSSICENALRMDQNQIDDALLQAVCVALDERILLLAVEKAFQQLSSGNSDQSRRRQVIERELSVIEGHERNLAEAIARGQQMDPLLVLLRAEGARKEGLIAELNRLTAATGPGNVDTAQLKRELLSRISDAKGLLGRQKSEARTILRKLITQPLQFYVFEKEGRRGYEVTGEGSYLALLPAPLVSPIVVSPTGEDYVAILPDLKPCKALFEASLRHCAVFVTEKECSRFQGKSVAWH